MGGKVVAAVVAIAMVIGAIVVRSEVIEGGGGDGGGGGSRASSDAVICGLRLDDTCSSNERVLSTVDRLVEGGNEDLRWITPGPWPEIVDEGRAAAGKSAVFDRSEVLATSDLVAVVKNKPQQCAAEITWRCLGDAAGSGVRISGPGVDDPLRLLMRAALLGGYLGRSDYAINDVRDDPAVLDWLAGAERGIDRTRSFGASSLNAFLVQSGSADVFITTAADVRALEAAGAVTPTPRVRVDVVLGTSGRDGPGGAADALKAKGWEVPPKNSRDDGLPSPGVLLALREVTS